MSKYCIPEIIKDKLPTLPNGHVILERQWITTNDLIYIQQNYLDIPLSDLTSNLKFYVKTKEIKYDPRFKKQLDELKAKVDEHEYQSMLNKNYCDDKDFISPAEMSKEVKNHITTIFNVLLSVVSVAYAVWYWSNSSGYFSLSTRVLMSLFFALLTLIAEVVMFNAFNRRVEEAKDKERKKKEIKKVVERIL